jgi:hypothetical protein
LKEFIETTNEGYEKVHRSFEEQFWGTKMALSNGTPLADGKGPATYSTEELTRTKMEMEAFLADKAKLLKTREFLSKSADLSADQIKTLKMFERTFGCYIMESDVAKGWFLCVCLLFVDIKNKNMFCTLCVRYGHVHWWLYMFSICGSCVCVYCVWISKTCFICL